MSQVIAVYDAGTGNPRSGLTPTFNVYRSIAGPRTPPLIRDLGGGLYDFSPSAADVTAGTGWVITLNPALPAAVIPPYASGGVGYDQFFGLYNAGGVPTAGLTAAIASYRSSAGAAVTPVPGILDLGGGLYGFSPTAADRALDVQYEGATTPPGIPARWYGSVNDFNGPPPAFVGVTLLELRNRCKQESDNVGQSFITDAEWDTMIRASYQELYGLIVSAFGNDYFTQSPASGFTILTDGVNEHFALPSDFFKLLAVDIRLSAPNYWVALKPFQMSERNDFGYLGTMIPMAGQTLRLLYVPRAPLPYQDVDVIDGVNGWEEYIVVDVVIKALVKEESDVTAFGLRKAGLLERLQGEITNRDAGSPACVADVQRRRGRSMRYRLNGNQLWLRGNGMPAWGPDGAGNDFGDGGYW
jgi:hypothetical protein